MWKAGIAFNPRRRRPFISCRRQPGLAESTASAQAGARAAAHKRNLVARADAHHRLHLLGISRQHHGAGQHTKVGEAVTLIGLQLALAGDQALRADGSA